MRNVELEKLIDLLCEDGAGLKNVKFFIPSGSKHSCDEVAAAGYKMIQAGRESVRTGAHSIPPRVPGNIWTSQA